MTKLRADVLIVGAGPAGIAAASVAAKNRAQVLLIDDNAEPGGQIWRGSAKPDALAQYWLDRFNSSGVQFLGGTRALGPADHNVLLAERETKPIWIRFDKLILATGARELFLPFPGWTLPGVTGAGGLQALVQGGVPIKNQRVVVAGSGPLLLAVAAHLKSAGARILAVAEQASRASLGRFGAGLSIGKLVQAGQLARQLRGVPLLFHAWPIRAEGDGCLRAVHLRTGKGTRRFECEYLACGFGLVPNTELAQLFGCKLPRMPGAQNVVAVDEWQRTTIPGVLCAGEPTGIGGLERSLFEGEVAGNAATEALSRVRHLAAKRRRLDLFSDRLKTAFSLRPELRDLPLPETIVCRCEDVRFEQISKHSGWRSAKLETRCGMGPCQGRICGPAVAFLQNWHDAGHSVRLPVYPASLATLASLAPAEEISRA